MFGSGKADEIIALLKTAIANQGVIATQTARQHGFEQFAQTHMGMAWPQMVEDIVFSILTALKDPSLESFSNDIDVDTISRGVRDALLVKMAPGGRYNIEAYMNHAAAQDNFATYNGRKTTAGNMGVGAPPITDPLNGQMAGQRPVRPETINPNTNLPYTPTDCPEGWEPLMDHTGAMVGMREKPGMGDRMLNGLTQGLGGIVAVTAVTTAAAGQIGQTAGAMNAIPGSVQNSYAAGQQQGGQQVNNPYQNPNAGASPYQNPNTASRACAQGHPGINPTDAACPYGHPMV